MGKNIFKHLETEKEVPDKIKQELMANIEAVEKGKEPSALFNTNLFGALVNFFKLNRPR